MSQYKITIVGLGGVGKSCLVIQFVAQRFVEEYDPTLEDSYRKHISVDGEEYILDIYDTAGQEDFSAVRDQYMRTSDGFLCVYSITYAVSYKEVRKLHDHVLRVKEADSEVPFVLVGNKSDLDNEREVSFQEGEQLAKEIGCPFMETSCKTRVNVKESFHQLVREVKAWKRVHEKDAEEPTHRSSATTQGGRKKSKCFLL